MNRTTAATLARTLMNDHGLGHWTFQFDRAKRRFGQCRYGTNTISLSAPLVTLNDEAQVHNTILHEIAHALVGPGHGHDYVWRAKARAIGCDGLRCYQSEAVARPPAAWVGVCPSCGKSVERHRLSASTRRAACSACCNTFARGRFDDRFLLVWKRQSVAA